MPNQNILSALVKPCPWITWLESCQKVYVVGSKEEMWKIALSPYLPILPFS